MTKFILTLVTIFLLSLILPALPSAAQEPDEGDIQITRTDTTKYPEVTVYLQTGNLSPAAVQGITLLEDRVTQQLVANEQQRVGTLTAIILDASGSIERPGATGETRIGEIADAFLRLDGNSPLSAPDQDRLMLITPLPNLQSQPVVTWTLDHNQVINGVTLYELVDNIGNTSLPNLLQNAIISFDPTITPIAGVPPELRESFQKSIIVFTDGIGADPASDPDLQQRLDEAQEKNIQIYTILLGQEEDDTQSNLQAVAAQTGGQYYHLNSVDALDPLWEGLVNNAAEQVLTYRSQKADPLQITVQASANDTLLEAKTEVFAPPLTPPNIRIISPAENDVIERRGDTSEATISELNPKEVTLEIQISWPDNHPRGLREIEIITLAGGQLLLSELPVDPELPTQTIQVPFPITDIGEGSHKIEVLARGELGLLSTASQDATRNFQIIEVRPSPPPTATPVPPEPTAVPTPTPTGPVNISDLLQQYGIWLGGAVVALVVVFIIVLFLRRKPKPQPVPPVETPTGTLGQSTEAWTPEQSTTGPDQDVKAILTLESREKGELPSEIHLRAGNTRFGREATLADVVLQEPRISRYHCRIQEEADGTFRIWDEGSSSGTYVNRARVGMAGQILKTGDQINFGPVEYRFESIDPIDQTIPYNYAAPFDSHETLDGPDTFQSDTGQPTEPEE